MEIAACALAGSFLSNYVYSSIGPKIPTYSVPHTLTDQEQVDGMPNSFREYERINQAPGRPDNRERMTSFSHGTEYTIDNTVDEQALLNDPNDTPLSFGIMPNPSRQQQHTHVEHRDPNVSLPLYPTDTPAEDLFEPFAYGQRWWYDNADAVTRAGNRQYNDSKQFDAFGAMDNYYQVDFGGYPEHAQAQYEGPQGWATGAIVQKKENPFHSGLTRIHWPGEMRKAQIQYDLAPQAPSNQLGGESYGAIGAMRGKGKTAPKTITADYVRNDWEIPTTALTHKQVEVLSVNTKRSKRADCTTA